MAVPIGIGFFEVIVTVGTVALGVSSADAVIEVIVFQCYMGIASPCAVGASLQVNSEIALQLGACDDVDSSCKGLTAVDTAGSTLNHFDALDVIYADWQIDREVTCVRAGNVDAVEQNGELVFCAAIHTDVGLDAETSALAHIHACCQFQQVVDGVGTGSLYVLPVDDLDDTDGFVGWEWGASADDFGVVEVDFVCRVVSLLLCHDGRGSH